MIGLRLFRQFTQLWTRIGYCKFCDFSCRQPHLRFDCTGIQHIPVSNFRAFACGRSQGAAVVEGHLTGWRWTGTVSCASVQLAHSPKQWRQRRGTNRDYDGWRTYFFSHAELFSPCREILATTSTGSWLEVCRIYFGLALSLWLLKNRATTWLSLCLQRKI